MPISTAVQNGSFIYIFDEKGRRIAGIPAGDGLHGYTAATVSVRNGSWIYIYDENGRRIHSVPLGKK